MLNGTHVRGYIIPPTSMLRETGTAIVLCCGGLLKIGCVKTRSVHKAALAKLFGKDAIVLRRRVNPALEQRRIAVHGAMINHCDIRCKRERAVKNPIDDAVPPISLVDRRHDKNDLDAMAAADAVDGLHLLCNFLLIAGLQRPVGLLQGALVLNERRALLRSQDKLRAIAAQGTRPELRHAAQTSVGAEPGLQPDRQTPQPCRRIVVTIRWAQRPILVISVLKKAHDHGVVI